MVELEQYYTSEIYEHGMPRFEGLEHWQRSQMENSLHFKLWKARKPFETFKSAFLNTLGIPRLADWLSKFFK